MSHTIIFKTDYGHVLEVLVKEYDELTGQASPAPLDGYTTKQFIIKKPDATIVYIDAVLVASGESYLQATVPSGLLSSAGYYLVQVLLENDTQRFHSAEFGFTITTPKEQ
jgi:hypothetical protein